MCGFAVGGEGGGRFDKIVAPQCITPINTFLPPLHRVASAHVNKDVNERDAANVYIYILPLLMWRWHSNILEKKKRKSHSASQLLIALVEPAHAKGKFITCTHIQPRLYLRISACLCASVRFRGGGESIIATLMTNLRGRPFVCLLVLMHASRVCYVALVEVRSPFTFPTVRDPCPNEAAEINGVAQNFEYSDAKYHPHCSCKGACHYWVERCPLISLR
ncbi:T. brucei spp.-specific protein [Trypanosoma brucei gambiense DAL972]|uniref:T. brucei spp.-specific protein n=1 Tax=Trypanosoma brucei gambiense (strain MHOM/CI/86/DAL972) TaxID=679716 RepID=C9ZXN3_TRYB9|nr:T. brucei spp.-specific protein [Trypanosoma brucei gambiense DAL972]CBH14177.1 T. brucei spp.-specific protein [Trypanosoma brucei gambiense DAL972]|eukprot:XP_011776448.1 T. brucei spp.-specific protein [Trypanosoma brucei gambiense DAL972]